MARDIIATQRTGSVAKADSAAGRVKEVWEVAEKVRGRAEYLQAWHDNEIPQQDRPALPSKAPKDLKTIAETAPTPYARMLVSQIAQQMRVDDIRMQGGDSAPAWDLWQRNGMDGKQIPLVRAATTHGLAFTLVLPAVGRLDGAPTALIRPISSRRGTAFFRDDFDEFPEFFLDVDVVTDFEGNKKHAIRLVDDEAVYSFEADEGGKDSLSAVGEPKPHGMGVCPVQRHGMFDLDGAASGEIEPVINVLRRIHQDTTDRLVVQRFAAWLVRTASGISDKDGLLSEEVLAWLSAGDILVDTNKDAKFGTLPPQPLDGHLRSQENDVRELSVVGGIPSYRTLGLGDNIGAEAIAAADKSLDLKVDEMKVVYGEQYEAMMRLAGMAAGNEEIARDFTSRVHWAPLKTGSFQTIAQALAGLSDDKIPLTYLLRYLPDMEREDIEIISGAIEDRKAQELAEAELLSAATEGANGGDTNAAPGAGAPNPSA